MINNFYPENRLQLNTGLSDSTLTVFCRNTILTRKNTFWVKQFKYLHGVVLDYILASGLEGKRYVDLNIGFMSREVETMFGYLFEMSLYQIQDISIVKKRSTHFSNTKAVFIGDKCVSSETGVSIYKDGKCTAKAGCHTNGQSTVKVVKPDPTDPLRVNVEINGKIESSRYYNERGFLVKEVSPNITRIFEYDENDKLSYINTSTGRDVVFFDEHSCALNGVFVQETYDDNGYLIGLTGSGKAITLHTITGQLNGHPNKTRYNVLISSCGKTLIKYSFIHEEEK